MIRIYDKYIDRTNCLTEQKNPVEYTVPLTSGVGTMSLLSYCNQFEQRKMQLFHVVYVNAVQSQIKKWDLFSF